MSARSVASTPWPVHSRAQLPQPSVPTRVQPSYVASVAPVGISYYSSPITPTSNKTQPRGRRFAVASAPTHTLPDRSFPRSASGLHNTRLAPVGLLHSSFHYLFSHRH